MNWFRRMPLGKVLALAGIAPLAFASGTVKAQATDNSSKMLSRSEGLKSCPVLGSKTKFLSKRHN